MRREYASVQSKEALFEIDSMHSFIESDSTDMILISNIIHKSCCSPLIRPSEIEKLLSDHHVQNLDHIKLPPPSIFFFFLLQN